MIYTSYFAKLQNIPSSVVPISICGKAPDWYTGSQYKKLAPKYNFFMEWKRNQDNIFYIREYYAQVLAPLKQEDVLFELLKLSMNKDIVLLCYEKPNEFCHRHLVAGWLQEITPVCELTKI